MEQLLGWEQQLLLMLLALGQAQAGVCPQQWTPGRPWQSLPQAQLPSSALQGP